jgi:hypothetical protein
MMIQHHIRYPCALTRLVLLLLVCFTSCAALEEHHTTSTPLHRRITEREIHVDVPLESEKILVNGEEKRYIPVGLEPLSSYELRVSYVSSHSVQIRFGYACGSISGMEGYQQRRRYGRKLLNAEKIVFKTDANSAVIPSPLEKEIKQGLGDDDSSCRGEKRAVMLTLEVFPWGMMRHNENSIGLFEYDVVLEKNYLGIPVSSVPVLSMALGSVGMLLVFGVGWWMRVVVKDYLGYDDDSSSSTHHIHTA